MIVTGVIHLYTMFRLLKITARTSLSKYGIEADITCHLQGPDIHNDMNEKKFSEMLNGGNNNEKDGIK